MNWIDVFTLLAQIALFLLIMSLVFRASPLTLSLRVVDQAVRNASGMPVLRLSQITPQLYVGGQHGQRGWRKLQDAGITAIINMREAHHDDRVRGIAPEYYLHLPTIDGTPPTMEQLHQGVAFINEEIARGGKIYIHCASGFHRAPTMAAAYLVSTGLTHHQALARIKKVRSFARPVRSQTKQLELFAGALTGNVRSD